MAKVGDVLAQKEDALHYVAPTDTVLSALEIMSARRIRAVVVLDEGRLVGIVAERDCALKVLLPGLEAARTTVEQVMTHDVVTVTPTTSLDRCMVEMTTRSIRHLPVVHGARVIGMISVGDVVKETMREQTRHIGYLESYIKGHGVPYQ
ncbi:MAG: CBS domain-containing protein [Burkholderiales bacterium]|jgi:CBS domain-containing protein